MTNDMDVGSGHSTADTSCPRITNLPSSELRFPIAAADGSIGNLLETTSPSKMQTHIDHDEESLAGSTYEFVDTDVESRDGHTTASIASTDVGRPEDVASLADTAQSEDENTDEEDNQASTLISTGSRSLERTSVLETPTIGRSSVAFYNEPQIRSIEFEEFYAPGAETVSVRHTVEEFSRELTNHTLQGLNLVDGPQHLTLTIRQTMTKSGLTTKDPLRVLYVGSHAARQDIVTKIASCLSASNNYGSKHYQSQIYNVVPVSASAEEVELMQSSGLQIKVEDCIDAECMPFEDVTEKPEIIKLRLAESGPYHSVPEGKSFMVEPAWELPHVAVFYCSKSDTSKAKQTRTLARKFMSRHGVPALVITHQVILDRSLCLSLDQHAVHMCLEGRDTKGQGNIIRHRLPIDLTSFLNIDARQMSRNLAYITGLHESMDTLDILTKSNSARSGSKSKLIDRVKRGELRNFLPDFDYRHLLSFGVLLLSVVAALVASTPAYHFTTSPAISVNSKTMQATSTILMSQATGTSSAALIYSTSTSKVMPVLPRTTKIVKSPQSHSLSVLPSKEVRVVAVASPEDNKLTKISCSAEIVGDKEVLIHVPASAKPRWLSRDAISIIITRNDVAINTERVYNTDKGIVLLLPVHETYGVLNISISTTKKPKINDTITVDFGTTRSQAAENMKSRIYSIIEYDRVLFGVALKQAQELTDVVINQTKTGVMKMENSTSKVATKITKAGTKLVDGVKALSSHVTESSLTFSKEVGFRAGKYASNSATHVKQLRNPARQALLKAQIQSKLAWLKLQGKSAEYDEYKKRALVAMKNVQGVSGKCARKNSAKANKKCVHGRSRVNHIVPG